MGIRLLPIASTKLFVACASRCFAGQGFSAIQPLARETGQLQNWQTQAGLDGRLIQLKTSLTNLLNELRSINRMTSTRFRSHHEPIHPRRHIQGWRWSELFQQPP